MKCALAALALFALPPSAVFAQDPESPAAETPAPSPSKTLRAGDIAPDGTKVVCRKISVIGTRFPQRECKSKAAWEEFDAFTKANAKNATDNLQRNRCRGEPGRC